MPSLLLLVMLRLIDFAERTVGVALQDTPRTVRLCALIITTCATSGALVWLNDR